jgi:hypothetical protein
MGEGQILGRIGQKPCTIGIRTVPESWDDRLQIPWEACTGSAAIEWAARKPLQNRFRTVYGPFSAVFRGRGIEETQANRALDRFLRDRGR